MKFNIIAQIIIFIFSLFGLVIFTSTIHELSHKQDLKEIAEDDSICILNWPLNASIKSFYNAPIGYYKHYVNSTNLDEYDKIKKYTEFKAYTTTIIIIITYFVCLFFILNNKLNEYYEKKYAELR